MQKLQGMLPNTMRHKNYLPEKCLPELLYLITLPLRFEIFKSILENYPIPIVFV